MSWSALTAILVNQGLRAGGDGAHAVLLDVVRAQLHPTATADDVREALPAATAMIDAAAKVVDQMPAY